MWLSRHPGREDPRLPAGRDARHHHRPRRHSPHRPGLRRGAVIVFDGLVAPIVMAMIRSASK
ncbi:MAG: hypothetical protein U5L11_08445 [Arhodomonas sp.]|nr:hypothetical protein [Arhodomonas sp.]